MEKRHDKMERFITKAMLVSQFVTACVIFLCMALSIAANIARGRIASNLVYPMYILMLYIAWKLAILSYREMREEFGK